MKKTIWFGVVLVLALAPLSFAGTLDGCTSTGSVSDGSGGFFVQGNCNFYQDPGTYPLDLSTFIASAGSAYIAENYFIPGYIVFTTDPTEVALQTGSDQAAWQSVLFFDNNAASGTASSQAILEWGATLPSVSTVNNFTVDSNPGDGEFFVLDTTGTTTVDGTNVNITVHDGPSPTTSTPEPSSFLMMAGAGLAALWRVRRRCI